MNMVIIVYSETNSAVIERNFGASEYSYYFVLKAFHPILQQIGRVITVTDPGREVDAIYRDAVEKGEDCIFFSFSPPHRTPLDLACPTIPVIAWEYNTIPSETWSGERHQDWRFVLNKLGRAITLSSFSADAIRSAMGPDFPVAAIPAPIFDRLKALRTRSDMRRGPSRQHLRIPGLMMDTRAVDLAASVPPAARQEAVSRLMAEGASEPVSVSLAGVIYTSILNPVDYRKNYSDLLGGFCWALREAGDATLILKLSHRDAEVPISNMMEYLSRLSPFKCRVILIGGYLSDEEYGNLLLATTYAVNTSQGEGQCIPLMESMSVGTPVVAPRHTAMVDYLSTRNAFVVASTVEPAAWPQDPRAAYRALTYRLDFESLLNAFTESHRVATQQPPRYETMAIDAKNTMDKLNSDVVTLDRVREFLAMTPRPVDASATYGQLPPVQDAYSLGDLVDFGSEFNTRRYLGKGWGGTEFGVGVWSNGALAELCFRVEPLPTGPIRLRVNLTAFVVKEHPAINVYVSAEESDIAQWRFDIAQPELVHGSWHEAIIPPEARRNEALSIRLKIEHPASPRKLGLSSDIRCLGVLLHKLLIVPQARVE